MKLNREEHGLWKAAFNTALFHELQALTDNAPATFRANAISKAGEMADAAVEAYRTRV